MSSLRTASEDSQAEVETSGQLEEVKAQFIEVQSDVKGLRSQLQEAVTLVLALRAEVEQLTTAQQNVVTNGLVTTPPAEPSDQPPFDLEAIAAKPDFPDEVREDLEVIKEPTDDDISLHGGTEEAEEEPVTAPPSTTPETGTTPATEAISSSLPHPGAIAAGHELTRIQLCEYLDIRPNSKTLKKLQDSGELLSKYGWRWVRGSGGRSDPFIFRYEPQAIEAEESDISAYS